MSNVTVHPNGDIQINGRWLNIGSEVSVYGERGRFKYTGYTHSGAGKLILCFLGGKPGHELTRSFYAEKVKTVHNKRPVRPMR
ncbi:MAG: hypothetical protein ACKODT_07085 [Fluviibacter sp.]